MDKNIEIETGDYVFGFINDKKIIGRAIVANEDSLLRKYVFIMQNVKAGTRPNPHDESGAFDAYKQFKNEFAFCWFTTVNPGTKDSGVCTEGVLILGVSKSKEEVKKLYKDFNEPIVILDRNSYKLKFPDGKTVGKSTLFMIKQHPDCCGTRLVYYFSGGYDYNLTIYNELTERNFLQLRELLKSNRTAHLAHIAEYQAASTKFLEKLGFKAIHSYININSKNKNTLYQLDPIPQD